MRPGTIFIAAMALSMAALIGNLPGCTLLPESTPLRLFQLPRAALPDMGSGLNLHRSLRIHSPQASGLLSGPRIAVLPGGGEITSYQGARWADRAPTLVRDQLVDLFRQSNRFDSVDGGEDRLPADLELFGDLLAFQSEYVQGQPQVLIRFDAQLLIGGAQRRVASQRFEVRKASAGPAIEEVVQAFGVASDQLARQLLLWTLKQTSPEKTQGDDNP